MSPRNRFGSEGGGNVEGESSRKTPDINAAATPMPGTTTIWLKEGTQEEAQEVIVKAQEAIDAIKAQEAIDAVKAQETIDAVKAQETSKRVNFILSEGIYKGLEKLAKKKQTSVAEILRDAIALEIWLQKELEQGNTLLVGKGSKFKEVVFPR